MGSVVCRWEVGITSQQKEIIKLRLDLQCRQFERWVVVVVVVVVAYGSGCKGGTGGDVG